MNEVKLFPRSGIFAENKDLAREIRVNEILPLLEKNEQVVLDFQGVEGATQSFIHALISDIIRKKGVETLDKVYFKNCNDTVRKIVNIVVDYMQDIE